MIIMGNGWDARKRLSYAIIFCYTEKQRPNQRYGTPPVNSATNFQLRRCMLHPAMLENNKRNTTQRHNSSSCAHIVHTEVKRDLCTSLLLLFQDADCLLHNSNKHTILFTHFSSRSASLLVARQIQNTQLPSALTPWNSSSKSPGFLSWLHYSPCTNLHDLFLLPSASSVEVEEPFLSLLKKIRQPTLHHSSWRSPRAEVASFYLLPFCPWRWKGNDTSKQHRTVPRHWIRTRLLLPTHQLSPHNPRRATPLQARTARSSNNSS